MEPEETGEENAIQNIDGAPKESIKELNDQEESNNEQEEPNNNQEEPHNEQEEPNHDQEEPNNQQEEPNNQQEEPNNQQEEVLQTAEEQYEQYNNENNEDNLETNTYEESYDQKTFQFLQSILLTNSHKTAKDIQTKSHQINKYVDNTLLSICQIPSDIPLPLHKDQIDEIFNTIQFYLNEFKQSLIKYKIFNPSMNKKFVNATYSLKGQIISMNSKNKRPISSQGNIQQTTIHQSILENKQKASSICQEMHQRATRKKQINQSQLFSIHKNKDNHYYPIDEVQNYDFPLVTQSNFAYDELYREDEDNQGNETHKTDKATSIGLFGTTNNLFFALGFTDLLIITDSSMAISDKLVLEKANMPVEILYASEFIVFFSHTNYLHIFNFENKLTDSMMFRHHIVSLCPVLYYQNCLCAFDSFENIHLLDYTIPKLLGSFQSKFIKDKGHTITSVITLNNHLVLGGTTIKLFDLKNKKIIPSSKFIKGPTCNVLPNQSNPIIRMTPIVINGSKYLDSFICLLANGTLEIHTLDKHNHLTKTSVYDYEGSQPTKSCNLMMTMTNLILCSVGYDIKIYKLSIKEGNEQKSYLPFMTELGTIRVNNVIHTMFETKNSMILHGEDLIERFMFIDLDDMFLRKKDLSDVEINCPISRDEQNDIQKSPLGI